MLKLIPTSKVNHLRIQNVVTRHGARTREDVKCNSHQANKLVVKKPKDKESTYLERPSLRESFQTTTQLFKHMVELDKKIIS